MGRQDAPRFEAALERQIETLRALKSLERERARLVRSVGASFADPETAELRSELRRLAEDVRRAGGVAHVALARNAALVETRIGLHRQAGTLPGEPGPFVHRVA